MFFWNIDGFTLIELLIVITILVTVVGFGLASYNGFNRRERLKQTALTLKSNLRFAQTKAISAEKPSSGCSTFVGIEVGFSASAYTTQHVCAPEGVIPTADCTPGSIVDCVLLPSDVTFSHIPSNVTFQTLTNRASITSDLTITLTNGMQSYALVVSPNGSVSERGFQ